MSDLYRQGMADAVLKIALARFWPMTPTDEIADAAGVTPKEFREAIQRARGISRPAPPTKPSRSRKPVGPPGTKWCVRGDKEPHTGEYVGHFVRHEDFGVNRSRNDGFSDFCKACWRDYWRERRAEKKG